MILNGVEIVELPYLPDKFIVVKQFDHYIVFDFRLPNVVSFTIPASIEFKAAISNYEWK